MNINFRQMLSKQATLDQFVSDVMTWPTNDWASFAQEWKYRDVCKMLIKYRSHIDTVLGNTLNAKQHSLAYSYLLGFKSGEKMEDVQFVSLYLNQIRKFIFTADSRQICLFPRPFTDALRIFVEFMKKENNFLELIPLLKRCITICRGNVKNNHILTFAHCDLMYCCLQTYCYHLATPFVDNDIITVQGSGCLESMDTLRYFYYCALIKIGVKDYRSAMEHLVMVLTAPSESLSVIQICAYKKYILVSLIRKQTLMPLPRYTPRILTRYFPKFAGEYLAISNVFNMKKSEEDLTSKLAKIIEKNAEQYTKDNNFGLVKAVVKSLQKFSVKKLTSVYTRLSIKKVAQLCHFKDELMAKKVLISMIKNGDLSASLDSQCVVTFYDGTITESDQEMLRKIQVGIGNTLGLWTALDKQQLQIKTTKEFVNRSLNIPSSMGMNQDLQEQLIFQSVMSGMGGGRFFGGGGNY